MNRIFYLIIFLSLSITVWAQKDAEAIILKTQTGNIHGSLLIPEQAKKVPLAIIVSGSGPTDRNGNNPFMTNNSLKMLAEALVQRGVASLRFDKRGVAASKSAVVQEKDLRFEHYVEDVMAWIDLLKQDKRFSKIVVIGHSEGALIGLLASQEKPVDAYVSLAGPAEPAAELIREQLGAQPQGIKDMAFPVLEKIEKGEKVNEVPQMLFSLFRPSVQDYLMSWFKYNPQEELSKFKRPVLVVQGSADIQVSTENAKKLAEANNKAQLKIIEGMNHVLKNAPAERMANIQTYSQPDLAINEELVNTIANFILKGL